MVADILGHNDDYLSLPAVLAAAARRRSDSRVVLYAATGIAIALCAVVFRPIGWTAFTGFGMCIGAFGSWAIADREVRERATRAAGNAGTLVWRGLRGASAALGTAGASLLLFLLLAAGLGTWKS